MPVLFRKNIKSILVFLVMAVSLYTSVWLLNSVNDTVNPSAKEFASMANKNQKIEQFSKVELSADKDGLNKSKLSTHKFSLIIPDRKHKIIYCPIPKNACAMFKRLMFKIHKNDPFSTPHAKHFHSYFKGIQDKMEVNKYKNIVKNRTEQDWKSIVIIRDPLERLVSGFIDKCTNENRRFCPSQNWTIFTNKIINMSVKTMGAMGVHFKPQRFFCSLYDTFANYDYQILYKYDTIADDVLSFLNDVNMTNYYYHWGQYANISMFQYSVHITNKVLDDNITEKIKFYKEYYTKDLARKLLNTLFQRDYDLFNLSYPPWLNFLD